MTAQGTNDVNAPVYDDVHHPRHYNTHPSGIECKEISSLLPGNLSHVCVYLWRHEHKGSPIKDLEKALFFLNEEEEITPGEKSERLAMRHITWARLDDRLRPLRKLRRPLRKLRETDWVAAAILCLCGDSEWGVSACKSMVVDRIEELRAK